MKAVAPKARRRERDGLPEDDFSWMPALDPAVHNSDGVFRDDEKIIMRRDWLRTRLPGRQVKSPLDAVGTSGTFLALVDAVGHVVSCRGRPRSPALAALVSSYPEMDAYFATVDPQDSDAWDMIERKCRGRQRLKVFTDRAFQAGAAYLAAVEAEAAEQAAQVYEDEDADDEDDTGYVPTGDEIMDAEIVEDFDR